MLCDGGGALGGGTQQGIELAQPVALAVDMHDRHVVQQAVEDGRRQDLVPGEDLRPVEAVTGGAPTYGTVRYVHALGLDAPVAVLDNRFSDARVLHYNWRGLAEASSWTTGSPADNQLPGGPSTVIAWPAGEGVYFKRAMDPYAGLTRTWIGSLPSNGRDGSGMLYRRNRYYDPASGRFTQEDPIGIAGGMNQYGFAAGDPVSYTDPFGLAADTLIVDKSIEPQVTNCKQKSQECRDRLEQLENSTEYWEISKASPGQCAPYIIGCTDHTPVPGHGPGGSIKIIPGEFNRLQPYFVNSVSAISHEVGHATTDQFKQCFNTEACARRVEQVARKQAKLPP